MDCATGEKEGWCWEGGVGLDTDCYVGRGTFEGEVVDSEADFWGEGFQEGLGVGGDWVSLGSTSRWRHAWWL